MAERSEGEGVGGEEGWGGVMPPTLKDLEKTFATMERLAIILHNREQAITMNKLVSAMARSGSPLTTSHLEMMRAIVPGFYSFEWRQGNLHLHFNNNW